MTNDERMGQLIRIAPREVAAPESEPRAVTRARGLSELLDRRPELTGVYLPADVTLEAVRWSA
jgi:hypothetical protein